MEGVKTFLLFSTKNWPYFENGERYGHVIAIRFVIWNGNHWPCNGCPIEGHWLKVTWQPKPQKLSRKMFEPSWAAVFFEPKLQNIWAESLDRAAKFSSSYFSTVRNKSIRFFGRLSEVKSLAQRVVCLSSSVVIVCNVCIVAKRYVLPVKLSNQLNFVQQGVNKRQL